jgi:hypothetical protein
MGSSTVNNPTVKRLSPTDKLKRAQDIKKIGAGICAPYCKYIAQRYGVAEAVAFVDSAVDAYVDAYENVLVKFKIIHDFKEDKLANHSKRAAAWVVAGKDLPPAPGDDDHLQARNLVDNLFKFDAKVEESIYRDLIPSHFLLHVCAAFMEVKVTNIDPQLEAELLHNLTNHRNDATMEWMVTQMHALALASGGLRVTPPTRK